jgi:hypothetical protein
MIQPLVVTALNTSTYTAISLGASQSCGSISFWVDDGTAFYISDTTAGTVNGLTLANQTFNIDIAQAKGETIFYAKASAGTPNLVLMVLR